MGPLQDRADDMRLGYCLSGLRSRLQWGRSKTERMTTPWAILPSKLDTLQWGRSKTERMTICDSHLLRPHHGRFNGAAPRQSG
mgnify:FL=1